MDNFKYVKPDFAIVDKDSGKEVVVIECKEMDMNSNLGIQQLIHYMDAFYTEIGLLITPDSTFVVTEGIPLTGKKTDYEIKRIDTSLLFPIDQEKNTEKVQDLTDKEFESQVYAKLIELVEEIREGKSYTRSKLISRKLPYLLQNARVVKGA
ncbi:hypothetical protein [Brevibacillus dissolubilis]|uniref:hypothetical protein n=1 Tax=Brevibacillus dissolubilis TaxID=1844116 RepID=UPI0011161533|nr:hypothetical protein [Brevibacillus dissolubilis]